MRNPLKRKKKEKFKRALTASIEIAPNQFITGVSKNIDVEMRESNPKNENLLHLFCDQRDNYWLNIFEWEIWRSTHDPFLHKQTNWKQLPDHSLRNLFVLTLLTELSFHNPFPEVIRLKKDVKQKMKKLLEKIEKAEEG